MKYHFMVNGHCREYILGSVSKEIWDYIQEKFNRNADDYWDAVMNGEIPEEYRLGGEPDECDDIYHSFGNYLNGSWIDVEDENGNTVFHLDLENLRDSEVKRTRSETKVGKGIPYISSWVWGGKGGDDYEFETDNFDPKKLNILYSVAFFGDGHEFIDGPVITGFEYDGKELDVDNGSVIGKYGEGEFINRSYAVQNNE